MNPLNPPIEITAIHLDAFSGQIDVSVEVGGKWINILSEKDHGGHISHIVEANGIRSRKQEVA